MAFNLNQPLPPSAFPGHGANLVTCPYAVLISLFKSSMNRPSTNPYASIPAGGGCVGLRVES